jgi:hypothetical protein
MTEQALAVAAALAIGLCVASFGSGITRFAHEPSAKLPGGVGT